MSKVLVCLSNVIMQEGKPYITCFYDQLISALKECGNDVRVFIPNLFNTASFYGENDLLEGISENNLKEQISSFNPDLVISFNNANYKNIFDCVSCPVVIWDADEYKMWNQKEFIKKNKEKYTFFSFSEYGVNQIKEAFGLKDSQIFHVKSATNLKNIKEEQTTNISFIGSYFLVSYDLQSLINRHSGEKGLPIILNEIKNSPFVPKQTILEKLKGTASQKLINDFNAIDDNRYTFLFSAQNRVGTLYALCDMGLDLFGIDEWKDITRLFPEIGACLNQRLVYSAQDNQEIYNKSKICLNVCHCQSKNSMPWRIADVMATNGCLMSENLPMINREFGKYVKIPMFDTPYDVRSLAQKLLKDEKWRTEIVTGSNMAIEESYRFIHRFKQMEEILGISLCGPAEGGCSKILQPEYDLIKKPKKESVKKKLSFKNKLRYKLWKHLDKKLKKKNIIA